MLFFDRAYLHKGAGENLGNEGIGYLGRER